MSYRDNVKPPRRRRLNWGAVGARGLQKTWWLTWRAGLGALASWFLYGIIALCIHGGFKGLHIGAAVGLLVGGIGALLTALLHIDSFTEWYQQNIYTDVYTEEEDHE